MSFPAAIFSESFALSSQRIMRHARASLRSAVTASCCGDVHEMRMNKKEVMGVLWEMDSKMSSWASARAVRRDTKEDAMLEMNSCSALGVLSKVGFWD